MLKRLIPSALLLLTFTLSAQNMKKESITFNEMLLPLQPLSSEIKNYQVSVSTPYPENNDDVIAFARKQYEDELAAYPQKVEEAKLKYEQDQANYDRDVEMARENFRLESEAYQNLSAIERLAQSDNKPQLRLPSKPYYREPAKPEYRDPDLSNAIVYNPEALASGIKLPGYNKGGDNPLEISITLYNFEKLAPVQKSEEKNVYDTRSKQTVKKTTYYYETSHKRPTHLKITLNGSTIYDAVLDGTSEYQTIRTETTPNMVNLEKQSVDESLKLAQDFINNMYGYYTPEQTIEIAYVKNKGDYDDIEEAKNLCISGLRSFKYGEENADLNRALLLWETALQESDVNDKKARIDQKVTEDLLMNILKVSLVNYDIVKAENIYNKLRTMDLSYGEKLELEKLEAKLNDRKARAAAHGLS